MNMITYAEELAAQMLEVNVEDLETGLVKYIRDTEALINKSGGSIRSRQIVAMLITTYERTVLRHF